MDNLGKTISSHNNNYNCIRFFLAASVIYYHSFALTKAVGFVDYPDQYVNVVGLSIGGMAVDCFFFLSGLFVTQSFYRDKSPVNFLIRRFCRLWPGLFACLVVTAVIAAVLSRGLAAPYYLLEPSFYHYILRNSVFSLVWEIPGVFANRPYSAINGSIHTLPTEIKMYFVLLCAGLLLLVRSKRIILLAGLAILAAVLFYYPYFVKYLNMPDYGQAPAAMFFAGVATFAVAEYVRASLWIGLACVALAFLTPAPWNTAFTLAAATAAMIYVGRMKHGWRPKSDVSYGIYIYGWPAQQFILTFFPALNPYLLFPSALAIAFVLASISWRIVEKPAIALGQSLAAAWTRWRSAKSLSLADLRLVRVAEWPRFATVCLIFVACIGMRLASDRIHLTPISALAVKIMAFGPTETKAGSGFNVQASGASAIWVAFDRQPPDGTSIVFDGQPLETQIGPTLATASVPNALFAQSGDKTVLLELRQPGHRERSDPVTLHVR